MKIDEMVRSKFVCPKCKTGDATTKRFSATGTGFSKFFDIQHNQFITVSCTNCGYTEMYNPEVMEKKSNISNVLDFIFGG